MIVGLRGRRAFAVLRREGRRARGSSIEVQWRAADGCHRVAFSISRHIGSAVVRNRLRRRLRAVLQELAAAGDPRFRPGDYLLRVRPGAETLDYGALRGDLIGVLERLGGRP